MKAEPVYTTVGDPPSAESIFERNPTDPRALVLDGYGVSLTVQRGHLVLADGVGSTRRERRLSRIERTVQRIVVLAPDGYVTLDAIRWCAAVGVTVTQVDRDGAVVLHAGTSSPDDAPLRRAQAVAGTPNHPAAVHLARLVLAAKLTGQADILENVFLDRVTANSIRDICGGLSGATSVDMCRSMEGGAGSLYWQTWFGSACPHWDPTGLLHLPAHWCMFTGRASLARTDRRNRTATDPTNAALNYCYALAESACRTELLACGLDPLLGVLHADRRSRDSLALDLLETIRPDIDRTVIDRLGCDPRRRSAGFLSRNLFLETRTGEVRLCPPLTHEFAEHLPQWGDAARPYARKMADLFTAVADNSRSPDYDAVVAAAPRKPASRGITPDDVVRVPGSITDIIGLISDELWSRVADVLAEKVPPSSRPGRPPVDNRTCLTALLVRMNGHPIPAHLGVSRDTVVRRLAEWKRSGAWEAVRRAVEESETLLTGS